mmetsp:Transcript_10320/g.29240  ORF Transcript_10320/g.29240 Transcript_10320/m.29240 type:complete len:725 (-) Transcript_10320:321-2495(-)
MGVDEFLDQDFEESEGGEGDSESLSDLSSLSSLSDDSEVDVSDGEGEASPMVLGFAKNNPRTAFKSEEQLHESVREDANKVKNTLLKNLEKETRTHKEALEALKEKDPEFYKYLQESESNLLEFGPDEDAGPEDSDSDSSEEYEDRGEAKRLGKDRKKIILIDDGAITTWCTAALTKGSLGAVKNVLKAYRVGCHYGDDDDETNQISVRLSDSNVFNQLMLFVLKNVDTIFRRLLQIESGQKETEKAMQSKKWTKVEPLVKSYLGNTLHLVSNVTEPGLAAYVYQRLRASVDLFTKFPVLSKKLLKLALKSFGSDIGNVKVDKTARIQSVLLVRSLALSQDTLLDESYRGLYRTYQSAAKFASQQNISSIRFMQDCLVEVFCMKPDSMYKHVFNFVKEVALFVRNSLIYKTQEHYYRVYSWEVICSLDLLESLISKHGSGEKDVLQPMLYPLVQVMMMTVTLVPSSRYLPLRFHVLKSILRLSKKTGVFIPLSSLIIDALNFSELSKKPQGVGNHFNFMGTLKVPKDVLKTTSFQEQWVSQTVLLLAEHCSQWSHHIAFPELFLPLGIKVKGYMKSDSLAKKFKAQLAQFLEAGQIAAESMLQKRQVATFSPKDAQKIELFINEDMKKGASPMDKFYQATLKQVMKQDKMSSSSDVLLAGDRMRVSNKLANAKDVPEYSGAILDKEKRKRSKAPRDSRLEGTEEVHNDEDRVEDFEMSDSESEE